MRRDATAGIFALFYISLAVASVVAETARQTRGRSWGELAPLLAPTATLEGLTAWLFDTRPTGNVFRAGTLPGPFCLTVAVGLTVGAMGLMAWRYRRMPL